MVAIMVFGVIEGPVAAQYEPGVLGDVGDAWRALLLGAPPALL